MFRERHIASCGHVWNPQKFNILSINAKNNVVVKFIATWLASGKDPSAKNQIMLFRS